MALIVGKVLADSRLGVDANEYVQRFRPEVMEVFHAWATGHSFKAVLALSDFYEVLHLCALRAVVRICTCSCGVPGTASRWRAV